MSTIFPLPHSNRTSGPFTATAGQTDFPAGFPIQDDNDVAVWRTRGVTESLLVLDVDYEVLAAGNPDGFTVRLLAGAVVGDKIAIEGDAVIERTTSVVQAGGFNSRQVDREFDRSRIIDMELERRIDEISPPRPRRNGFSYFDSVGTVGLMPFAEVMTGAYDAKGPFAGRAAHDAKGVGFTYMDTDARPLVFYMREGAAGNWAGPFACAAMSKNMFDSRLAVQAAQILPDVQFIYIFGPGVQAKRLGGAPATVRAHHVKSANNIWFQYDEPRGYSPRMFGAAMDGVADDTQALLNAELAAVLIGNSTVLLDGPLKFTTNWRPMQGVALIGTAGIIDDTASLSPCRLIKAFNGNGITVDNYGVYFRNIEFRQASAGAFTGDMIEVLDPRFLAENCIVKFAGRDSWRVGSDAAPPLMNANAWKLINCYAKAGGRHGLRVHHLGGTVGATFPLGAPDVNSGEAQNFEAAECGGHGVSIGNATSIRISGNLHDNVGRGFEIDAEGARNIIVGYWEQNAGGPSRLAPGSIGNSILAIRQGGTTSLTIDDSGNDSNWIDGTNSNYGTEAWSGADKYRLAPTSRNAKQDVAWTTDAIYTIKRYVHPNGNGGFLRLNAIGTGSTGWGIVTRNQATGVMEELANFDGDVRKLKLMTGAKVSIGGLDVVGPRDTGWTVDVGTAKKTANTTYPTTAASAAYSQAQMQAVMDALRDATQTIKALKDERLAAGSIGA